MAFSVYGVAPRGEATRGEASDMPAAQPIGPVGIEQAAAAWDACVTVFVTVWLRAGLAA
jgi:hypothetical protein